MNEDVSPIISDKKWGIFHCHASFRGSRMISLEFRAGSCREVVGKFEGKKEVGVVKLLEIKNIF